MGHPNGKMCLIIIAALSVFVIMSSLYSVTNIEEPYNGPGPMGTRPIPEAVNRSHIPGTAFAFLALGAQANQMNCPAAIESLVRFSGWDGDIFLITDQEYCFNPQEIIKHTNLSPDKFHYVVTEENFNRGGFDYEHPNTIGFRSARVRSLNMKTQLFSLIPDPSIHTIAYVDCDILFTQPQCAQSFISTGPSWEDFPIRFSHVFRNNEGTLQDIHAGSFVVHRDFSKQTLALWHDQIAMGTDEGDNDAFMRLYRHYEEPKNQIKRAKNSNSNTLRKNIRQLSADSAPEGQVAATAISNSDLENKKQDSNSLVIPKLHAKNYKNPLEPGEISRGYSTQTDDQRNWFEKFLELENNRDFCMQHIPKARCARYGRKKIQHYVDRFHLKTYQGGHMYCTSAFLRPFLYGWFPLGYLPFCPKMEQIL